VIVSVFSAMKGPAPLHPDKRSLAYFVSATTRGNEGIEVGDYPGLPPARLSSPDCPLVRTKKPAAAAAGSMLPGSFHS
jgi:hypothetical protein